MRYFTRELYVRFNSPDDDEADRANEEWEAALSGYRKHLDGIRDRMPAQVRKLAGLCLHDAEILACDKAEFPPFAVLSLRQDKRIMSLIYFGCDRMKQYPAPVEWPFSKERTHWLYDELDLAPVDQTTFLHRVLWSDGRVLVIPFRSVFVHNFPLTRLAEELKIGRGGESLDGLD